MKINPSKIEPYSPTEMLVAWGSPDRPEVHEEYAIPYVDLRYYCPCASCVDEHTGERVLQKTSISPDIRATGVQLVGRYAIQITWSDKHDTGMFSYERLRELSEKLGRKLSQLKT